MSPSFSSRSFRQNLSQKLCDATSAGSRFETVTLLRHDLGIRLDRDPIGNKNPNTTRLKDLTHRGPILSCQRGAGTATKSLAKSCRVSSRFHRCQATPVCNAMSKVITILLLELANQMHACRCSTPCTHAKLSKKQPLSSCACEQQIYRIASL